MNAPKAPMSPSLPRRRMSDTTIPFDEGVHAYRAHFSCRYLGKVQAKSKRLITWRFGICSNALDGSRHKVREEHQVELKWSIKSGKTDLVWNNQPISRYFPTTKSNTTPPQVVDFRWLSSSGVAFQIKAHVDHPEDGSHQYEFLIDGRSFFSLPSTTEFLAIKRESQSYARATPEKLSSPDGQAYRETSNLGLPEIRSPKLQRQSESGSSSRDEDNGEDALHSDLYSSSLDALRSEMSKTVPELDEMMSRAIIYAYSEDHDSLGSSLANDSLSLQTDDEHDPVQVEADALCETYEWMKWTLLHESENDVIDLKLEFMRKQVERMVAHARHDRLSTHAATRIMIAISSVLNLKLARRIERDTVILVRMDPGMTIERLRDALNPFGQIAALSIATDDYGFALCRFATESETNAACSAAKRNDLRILGGRVEMYNVFAEDFQWCEKHKESDASKIRTRVPESPGHRRRDLTISGKHWIDPQGIDRSVEIIEMEDSEPRRVTPDTKNGKVPQDSLELSSSKLSSTSPGSAKETNSGTIHTISTLSTFDGEQFNLTGTSIFLKSKHDI